MTAAFDRRAHPDGAAFSEWVAADGWKLRRFHWPAGAGPAARGTLLFAGGRGDFIEKYLEAMAHWRGRGWSVAGFDWRGQGASRGGSAGAHLDSLDPLVDDLTAIVDDLEAERPAPVVLVGHSMGGHVALRALVEQRVRPAAAVLVAPMLMINAAPLPPWAASWTASLLANFGWRRQPVWRTPPPGSSLPASRQAFLTSCPERYADELWWWEREPGFNVGAPSWGWLDAAFRSCAGLTGERLRTVETPILLLGTETDRLVSAAAIRRVAAALPRARLRMFENAGHELLREADPVRLEALAEIGAFLDEFAGT
ncbi:MAG TPA: alpha/beta hydrolase [Allosphingosinicella sp.]|nr:alpha/beta hydrolase [Allosphingosinicella sp.]